MIIHLIAGLIKKMQCDSIDFNSIVRVEKHDFHLIEMSKYFPKPYEPFGGDINAKVDLSNYPTKAGIENISHVDTSSFSKKKKKFS